MSDTRKDFNEQAEWNSVKAKGVLPRVKSLGQYRRELAEGFVMAGDYLRLRPELPKSEDLQMAHCVAFVAVHPFAGRYRKPNEPLAYANGRMGAEPTQIPMEMAVLDRQMEELRAVSFRGWDDCKRAAFAYARIRAIQPFKDGNTRMAMEAAAIEIGKRLEKEPAEIKKGLAENDGKLRKGFLKALDENDIGEISRTMANAAGVTIPEEEKTGPIPAPFRIKPEFTPREINAEPTSDEVRMAVEKSRLNPMISMSQSIDI